MNMLFRITQSYWLHVVMLALAIHAYNRTAYLRGWVTGNGRFSDVAAPLYASTQWWIPLARDMNRLSQATREHLPYLIPPAATALVWTIFVIWRLRSHKPLHPMVLAAIALTFVNAMNVTTAMIDGGRVSLSTPFRRHHIEYIGDVDVVRDSPAVFIRRYPQLGGELCHHSRTHPPGAVLFLWIVEKVFGGGVETAALVTIVVSSLTVLPALALARDRGGPRVALITAALYVVTPSLVLFGATCMDGVFAVLPVTGVWLMNRSFAQRAELARSTVVPSSRSVSYALAGGLVFSGALFLTYAVAALGVVYAALLVSQLRFGLRAFARLLVLMTIVLAMMLAVHGLMYWWNGFDPVQCLRSAIESDANVMESLRSHRIDVGFANLVAFIIGVGVVAAVAWWHHVAHRIIPLARNQSRDAWDLALFAGIAATGFLGWFTRETERIWLFLIPPILVGAAAALAGRAGSAPRVWTTAAVMVLLIAQTILMEFFLNTWW
jgi:hypothetical protein